MSAVALGVAAALIALRCELIRDDPFTLGAVSRVIPATRPAYLRALNATRRLVGCPEATDAVEPPPQFTGGQCDLVQYDLRFDVIRVIDGDESTSGQRRTVLGPVGPITLGDNGNAVTATLTSRAIANGGQCAASLPPGELISRTTTTNINVVGVDSYSLGAVTIERCDGLPDLCGSPGPDYPPPINIDRSVNVTFSPDLGPDVDVDIPFTFSPTTVNFDGTLRIPFTFDFGGFEYSGNISLPDFNVSINPPALPPGSGEDLTGQGDDEPGTTIPPVPPDEKIIGVVVTATTIVEDKVSSYSSPGITPIYIPRLGSIKFVYSLGGATFFSSDIDVKDRRTFVECPFPGGADAVIASPQVGVDFSFLPIRGFALATKDDVRAALDT